MKNILVTGGAGFIGSHFVRSALERGFGVIVLDDLSTGSVQAVSRDATFVEGDIADQVLVRRLLRTSRIDGIVHFASKISVGESVTDPRLYFESNVAKTLALLNVVIDEPHIGAFLFSSSAAVYAASDRPLAEDANLAPTNPYGMSKLAVEHVLESYGHAYALRWAALRYFNAAGAHPDGTLCEAHEPETHLIPLAIDAALGKSGPLTIHGDDYPTHDGTCVRDYVHVCDLADAHVAALDAMLEGRDIGRTNLGTGCGFSVNEVIETCERIVGAPVPRQRGPRRAGDPAMLVANAERARHVLNWKAKRPALETIVEDAMRSRNR
jgi:UDP-glucose-4-epimerase GalE